MPENPISLKRSGWQVELCLFCLRSSWNTEKRGRGLGVRGKGTWGPDGPFPRKLNRKLDLLLRTIGCTPRPSTVLLPNIHFVLALRWLVAKPERGHNMGVRRIAGTNYQRVSPACAA